MKHAFRSALFITFFTFSSQFFLFIAQVIAAALFGAGKEMDAFIAAATVPQYVISVLLGSIGFVFIPVFIDYKRQGNERKAYDVAISLFNHSIIFLAVTTIAGILFVEPLLRLIAPGLDKNTFEIAVKLSIITWPTIIATGATTLLLSIHQAEKKFAWQAVVPFIGAVANLILLVILAPQVGIFGVAIATLCGVVIQALLLAKVLNRERAYKFNLNWRETEVNQILKLTAPMILVALVTKFTPLIDRYLASDFPEGSISTLNYSFKVVSVVSVLLSTGGAIVIFPKMATDVSNDDLYALKNTISFGLRVMWLIVAPVIAIGFSLSLPLTTLLFERGAFTTADSIAVAGILKIYLFALVAMCLGNVTGKGFYALKKTKTLAIFGTIEALAYIFYTFYLTRIFGLAGIAAGYVIYFTISLMWQLIVLRNNLGGINGLVLLKSFSRILLAAAFAGIFTHLAITAAFGDLLKISFSATVGVLAYLMVLYLCGSPEINLIKQLTFGDTAKKDIR
jgi:putative peptidoglycan lipid II flippase